MRLLMSALLFFPIILCADPIHTIKVDFTNNTDSPMHYDTLTIGQDSRIAVYPQQILRAGDFIEDAIVLTSVSNQATMTEMTYQFILPADMCDDGASFCTEEVTVMWETNMGNDDGYYNICGVSGKNYEPMKKLKGYCDLPKVDRRDPGTLLLHYYFSYNN